MNYWKIAGMLLTAIAPVLIIIGDKMEEIKNYGKVN